MTTIPKLFDIDKTTEWKKSTPITANARKPSISGL
jgi:hypothetical protein